MNFLKLVFLAPLIIYRSLIENGETSITRQVLAAEKTWPATAPYTYYNQLKIELQNLVGSKKIYHQISHLNRRVPQPLPSHITLEHHIPCSTNWLIIMQINCPQLGFFDASGPVRLSYNPYFSARLFSQNNVFLLQQIGQNSVSPCFFSEANGALSSNS